MKQKMKSKMDKVGYFNKETFEEMSEDIYKSLKNEDYGRKIKNAIDKLTTDYNSLTLEEIQLLRKTKKMKEKIQLDFKQDKYIIIKNNFKLIKDLNIHTRGVLYTISQMITHDGRLVYGNNRLINGFEELREYLDISKKVWSIYVKPDIDSHNILRKEKIHDKWCLLVNPIFAVKDRTVTETMFIAFGDYLHEHLNPLDYLYLKKLHGVDPNAKSNPMGDKVVKNVS